MTVNDLLKRLTKDDCNKVLIFVDDNGGWSNINITVKNSSIEISTDKKELFDE